MFHNRDDAGRQLAERLKETLGPDTDDVLVLGLPRGGVTVAAEAARALDAPLDVLVVRKLGAPGRPELAVGAITGGDQPRSVLNPEVVSASGADEAYIREEESRQLNVVRERERTYRSGRAAEPIEGRTVIVVDDGIATGATVRAALIALREREPKRLILAVPVAPPESLRKLEDAVDEVVCLHAPPGFLAVGQYYRDFSQTTDEEVIEMRQEAARDGAEA